jgi:hypothetical protein
MPLFEDRNPVAPRRAAAPGPRTLPDTFAGQVMRQVQQQPQLRQMQRTISRSPRQFSGREIPDTFYGSFGRAAQGNYQPPRAPGGMGMGGGGGGRKGLASPAQFGGEDIMQGLGAIGDLVRRGVATFNEFVPLGQPQQGAGYNAMQRGGMFPQQPAQPFFRRPAWLNEYYSRAGG